MLILRWFSAVSRALYDWTTVIGWVGLRLYQGLARWLWGLTEK